MKVAYFTDFRPEEHESGIIRFTVKNRHFVIMTYIEILHFDRCLNGNISVINPKLLRLFIGYNLGLSSFSLISFINGFWAKN